LNDARRVLLLGRRALGRPHALAVELADLAERSGAWEETAREWANAVAGSPSLGSTAAERLRDVPEQRRVAVLGVLTAADAAPAAHRLGAELQLAWGDPERAWVMFERSLRAPAPDAAPALRRFADLAGATGTPAGRRVRGLALARYADLVPPALASRARADAARALLDAGDHAAARRVLEVLAADSSTSPAVQALAHAALIRALLEEGQLDAATSGLDSLGASLAGEDRASLLLDLARARVAKGELEQAGRMLAGDSSVEATALRGWVTLYRGDLGAALELFRSAGPYAGRPGEATDRSQMLALLQRLGPVRSPDLGAAFLLLARGDSAGTLSALSRAAGRRELAAGRPDLLLVAGQVAARLGGPHEETAISLFSEVVRSAGDGAAPPAAELEWARVLLRQGKASDAVAHLEHLILTYPGSAVVPQARRELERARGAVPRS
jgi:tetratricopeptide (TPR) repeat protein